MSCPHSQAQHVCPLCVRDQQIATLTAYAASTGAIFDGDRVMIKCKYCDPPHCVCSCHSGHKLCQHCTSLNRYGCHHQCECVACKGLGLMEFVPNIDDTDRAEAQLELKTRVIRLARECQEAARAGGHQGRVAIKLTSEDFAILSAPSRDAMGTALAKDVVINGYTFNTFLGYKLLSVDAPETHAVLISGDAS